MGFEIKYPTGYIAKIGDANISFDPSFYISNPDKTEVVGILQNYAVELNVNQGLLREADGVAKNPKEWLEIQEESGDNYKMTTVGGQIAYVKDSNSEGIELGEYAFFINNGTMYDMYQVIIRKDDVGEKILSTLRFTK